MNENDKVVLPLVVDVGQNSNNDNNNNDNPSNTTTQPNLKPTTMVSISPTHSISSSSTTTTTTTTTTKKRKGLENTASPSPEDLARSEENGEKVVEDTDSNRKKPRQDGTETGLAKTKPQETQPTDKQQQGNEKVKDEEEIIDYAVRRGLKAGDRLQVLWTIQDTDEEEEEEEADNEEEVEVEDKPPATSSLTRSHWWGATLEAWDGTSEGGMAIRVLDYDAFPPNFPERSRETVVFATAHDDDEDDENNNNHDTSHDSLMILTYPDLEPLQVRRERAASSSRTATSSTNNIHGNVSHHHHLNDDDMMKEEADDDDEEVVVVGGREQVEQLLDGVLMGAMRKNERAWNNLTPAQQAVIAEQIALKKNKLLELIVEQQQQQQQQCGMPPASSSSTSSVSKPRNNVLSSADIQQILAQTMREE